MAGYVHSNLWFPRLLARAGVISISILALSACSPDIQLPFGGAGSDTGPELSTRSAQTDATALEVEAPEVYMAEADGLWDGRPSLGGVWVAHPDVGDPQRVLVTNAANGETVVGALFRRERENFGPPFMISSDAAAALNVVAGQPTELTVVALRRNEVPQELDLAVPPPAPQDTAEAGGTDTATALPGTIAATSLDPVEVAAAAPAPTPTPATPSTPPAATASALDVATLAANAIALSGTPAPQGGETLTAATPDATPIATSAPAPEPVTQVASAPAATALDRAYIQIGIYAVEANAQGAAADMRNGGVIPTVLDQSNAQRNLWRVIVGPARNSEERAALLETIRGLGYEDAYYVTN